MISKRTVLILAAGASAHVGYPLGSQLVANLCKLRGTRELDDLPEGWTRDFAESFLTRLSRSGHYSIDAFLETVREHVPLGKYLIARELKKYEDIDRLFPPNTSGWYQFLFNALLAADGSAAFATNLLGVITFNYDRSLEAYLDQALQHRFSIGAEEAYSIRSQVPIIHVHGCLGSYPEVPYGTSSDPVQILAISKEIQIIHEMDDHRDDFCNDMFRHSHNLLNNAEKILFMGFGFHSDNIRRFRFFTPEVMANRYVRGTAQGIGRIALSSLAKRMEAYGFPKGGAWADGHGCNDFFNHGESLD